MTATSAKFIRLCGHQRPGGARGLCGLCYQRWKKRGDREPKLQAIAEQWPTLKSATSTDKAEAQYRKRLAIDQRPAYRKRKYGMSDEAYKAFVAQSDGACVLCWNVGKYVDHDHKTGKVRGWLCPKCNTLVGYLENTEPALFARAMVYSATEGRYSLLTHEVARLGTDDLYKGNKDATTK